MLKTRTIAQSDMVHMSGIPDTGQVQGAYVPLVIDIEQMQHLCSAHACSQDSATVHHNARTKCIS